MKLSKLEYMNLNREEQLALKKILPHGGIKLIAEKTGLSYRSVQHVLNGKYKNEKVIEAAIEVIEEDNQRKKDFLTKLLKIVSEDNKGYLSNSLNSSPSKDSSL